MSRSRSKATALEYILTNEYVTIFGSFSVNRRSIPGYKCRYLMAVLMKYSNNLDHPTLKVKLI